MLRTLLTWLLLLNYLLVVGVGLLVSRPPEPYFSATNPYVHSKECQQHNYLRLDCFEHCNGDQHAIKPNLPTGTGLHYLAQLKGLDVHCPTPRWRLCRPRRAAGWLRNAGRRPRRGCPVVRPAATTPAPTRLKLPAPRWPPGRPGACARLSGQRAGWLFHARADGCATAPGRGFWFFIC
ncbi:MAG: hypothetical protein WKG07_05085 [Hymenobacter sp.]